MGLMRHKNRVAFIAMGGLIGALIAYLLFGVAKLSGDAISQSMSAVFMVGLFATIWAGIAETYRQRTLALSIAALAGCYIAGVVFTVT